MIEIYRSGNLLGVYNLPDSILTSLQNELSYTHTTMEGDGRGGLKNSSEVRKLWALGQNGELITNCGFIYRILDKVKKQGIKEHKYQRVDREDDLNPDLSVIDYDYLREGQKKMLKCFVENDGGLVVSPTGTGKTTVMGELCCMYPKARIVIAAPGVDAVETCSRYLRSKLSEPVGQFGGGKKNTCRVTVSTFNSLSKIDSIDKVDILIVDEVHKAPAKSYAEVLGSIISPVKRFGFTATSHGRSDNAELVNEGLFGPILLEIPYYDAVACGEIIPIHCIVHENWKGPPHEVTSQIKQFPRRDRLALWQNNDRNKLIANDIREILKKNPDIQVLVLVSKIEHMYCLKPYLDDMGFETVTGTLTKKRVEQYQRKRIPITYKAITNNKKRNYLRKRFENGELRRVIATEVWAQSVSANECSLVVYASGSGSPITCLQALGRASRTDNGKKHGTFLVYRDMFNKTYKNRSDKIIRQVKKHGHYLTVVK